MTSGRGLSLITTTRRRCTCSPALDRDNDAFADHSGLFGECILQFAERVLCYCEDIAFL
jgi:hypothetical protein